MPQDAKNAFYSAEYLRTLKTKYEQATSDPCRGLTLDDAMKHIALTGRKNFSREDVMKFDDNHDDNINFAEYLNMMLANDEEMKFQAAKFMP
ncbi:hypothetical protein BO70DRAFT_398303 [Aspergillus heteromorphus CBS 117.55]|uniref:EF-hand domain-containing protein n=1 Tax=Aspergillus heteromorphus CBS 117.55 TaxID=1448321 RepID=A0A317VPA5_9EURO|nr:uncharacterized protein BO70DRAFT_398303 [Aspergillus heteromorphus CBS 117.55]PWY75449.1 hypothetical protein BO70DRAFT_398303 [Aspergillus heteromorphus CBS 117.55]